MIVYFVEGSRTFMVFQNLGESSIRCIISCIDSGMFWTGIFEMPEEYIMVDYVVDRSL